jgi:signal transduction histidine kinase/CheY-like chemotaxis protein
MKWVLLLLLIGLHFDAHAQRNPVDASSITNRYGNIILMNSKDWVISDSAPDSISTGYNLSDGIHVSRLHPDSIKSVLEEKRYGWAELALIVDSTASGQDFLLTNSGYGAMRVWLNGKFVFQSGIPAQDGESEKLASINFYDRTPISLNTGINYLLVEFSFNTIPEWLHQIRSTPHNYVRVFITTPTNYSPIKNLSTNRLFLFGAVSFVLLILVLSHLYLSVKSVHKYHVYAFWTNLFLFMHVVFQMGNSVFDWTYSMFPAVHLSHSVLFVLVFYNMIHVIGSYYQLSLPSKLLRYILAVSLVLSVYGVLYQNTLINITHPFLALVTIIYAFYLLKKALKTNKGVRVAVLFSGLMVMLLGAFLYVFVYLIFYSGNYFIYYVSVLLVYVGVPLSFMITIALDFVDIYDQMEQKVIERTQELKEKDEFRSRFFLNISHELRTPTTILDGLITKASSSKSSSGLHISKEDSPLVLRNVKRLSMLVHQILDLYKSDKNELTLDKKNYRLDEIISNVVVLNQSFVKLRNQDINVNSKTDYIIINVDSDKVTTILSNVLLNASKYGPENSQILIETDLDHEKSAVYIDIVDEGDGVAHNDKEIIFERFHRIKNPDRPYVEGLGIGLELSRSLARLHNGDLEVIPTNTVGARFRLTLPIESKLMVNKVNEDEIDAEMASVDTVSDTTTAESNKQIRLLLVEDNPDMKAYISGLLKSIGTVHACNNGLEALEYLESNQVDIVISDLMMPIMSGSELIRKMAQNSALANIPVIVLSAKNDADERLNLLRVGIIDYISKPFDAKELKLKISNLMQFYLKRSSFKIDVT